MREGQFREPLRRGVLVRHPDGWLAMIQGPSSEHDGAWTITNMVGRSDAAHSDTEHWTLLPEPHPESGTPMLGERVA